MVKQIQTELQNQNKMRGEPLRSVIPNKDGRYYVKMLKQNMEICKGVERFENGKWQLGSGHFIISAVLEILDDADDVSIKPKQQSPIQ